MVSHQQWYSRSFLSLTFLVLLLSQSWAEEPQKVGAEVSTPTIEEQVKKLNEQVFPEEEAEAEPTTDSGDTAWMMMSCALVMLMVPGLALFYGGMVRSKNVLATLMQSFGMLAVVGVYWIAVGYSLAFGPSVFSIDGGGIIGWSWDLFFLKGIGANDVLPNGTIPTYVHVIFQGMFAIITPALISGAIAERIRFWPFCIFTILWITAIYCPLCHMVWAFDNFVPDVAKPGATAIGFLGKLGAYDFAGGTVVHISAGFGGLAATLMLGKRTGFPKAVGHPNGMVLTLLGAGLLWFGWFGFNGGSAIGSNALAGSAFAATQAAAAAAALVWMLIEWLHRGKPTALGFASGVVAGLVAVTPASGFVYIWGGLIIGVAAGAVCYGMVVLKGMLGYDDTLDAFGIHGIGGLLGALLTAPLCFAVVDGDPSGEITLMSQFKIQLLAVVIAVVFAFIGTALLVKLVQALTLGNFRTSTKDEMMGLDITEHGEQGFDLSFATSSLGTVGFDPTADKMKPQPQRFQLRVEGASPEEIRTAWIGMCQPMNGSTDPDFAAVYPYVTTFNENVFRFRDGGPGPVSDRMQKLFTKLLPGKSVNVTTV